ncbi:hypothetical protein [Planococcus versutus]|uniref:Uncharacterized protein n=1 Tax=Planococcus versutus TaxID=1302659 RepID=A0A1B1S5F6_9BACL|nr:hypothetical protein [Planococcus versutus]ANU28411.1 hypothetical protein I858_015585 [Planococcus versutus]
MLKYKVKSNRVKSKKNKFVQNNVIDYLRYSTPSELKFDFFVPLFITLIVTAIVAFIIPTPRDYASMILELNSLAITIIAILAGFNTASLAIIATVSNKNIKSRTTNENKNIPSTKLKGYKRLKNLIYNNPPQKELDAFVSFFAYAVISQLIIIVISLVINFLLTSILKTEGIFLTLSMFSKYVIMVPLSAIWIFLVLHSIFLSIRNIDMISHFIKFNSK